MSKKYFAALISTDGKEFVTDCHNSNSIDDIWQSIANMGSKWFFYPIPFILKESKFNTLKNRVIDMPDNLIKDGIDLRGKSIKSAMQWIADNQPYIQMILS